MGKRCAKLSIKYCNILLKGERRFIIIIKSFPGHVIYSFFYYDFYLLINIILLANVQIINNTLYMALRVNKSARCS